MPGHEFLFDAIGTHWQIKFSSTLSPQEVSQLQSEIMLRIDLFDQTYSRFREDSLVTKISQESGMYTLPHDSEKLITLYKQLYTLTNGAFTPLIGQLLSDAGYDASYSLKTKQLRTVPSWEATIDYHAPDVSVTQPVLLDFGAAGKGYLVDIVGEILKKNQIESFFINAGGDILVSNTENPLRVGLENPHDTKQVLGVAEISNMSICGSAGNRRAWGAFHHIMDPNTKTSVKKILATWVVADDALLADALTTALFFSPSSLLTQHFSFSYAILSHDFHIEKSEDFPAEFFI